MEEIIDKIPQLENRIYVIGGPREQALDEALTLILHLTDKHYLTTEYYCLKNTEEEIKSKFEKIAAATSLGKGCRAFFRTQKNGDVLVINRNIKASHSRRFVRLVFIDSLEAIHIKGKGHNREEVLKELTKKNPLIIVSDLLAHSDSITTHLDSNGVMLSFTKV